MTAGRAADTHRPGTSIVTRFAPSPTGYLHFGHAAAAHTAWRTARQAGGRFLLRIEDIDQDRCRSHFIQAILDDLTWLGLGWDGEIMLQSTRLALYRDCLHLLRARGLLYPCFCSRAEIRAAAAAPHDTDEGPLYPGTCRRITADARDVLLLRNAPHCWRLDMERALATAPPLTFIEQGEGEIAATPARFGDVVLGRRDMPASYHLCVTHDDAAQGVTLVTRGDDLKPATHLHRLLQHLFGWPTPLYAHHPLMRDRTGRRLSKRDGAPTLIACRQSGLTSSTILSELQSPPASPTG